MTEYVYYVDHRDYYKVEANTAEEAKEKLENCDDLEEFRTYEVDINQPYFEFWGIPNK